VGQSIQLQRLTPAQVQAEQRSGTLILDIRGAEQFASFHIRGAMQLGLIGPFASWAALLIDPAQKLLLVAADAASAHEAQSRLFRVGLFHLAGYVLADKVQWEQEGVELASFFMGNWKEVCCQFKRGALQLIDVRSRAEWLQGHLPGAISLPLLAINSAACSVAFSKLSLLYCQEGYLATTAASLLLRTTTAQFGVLIDREEAWRASQLPEENCLCIR
jgi:rhodanese-related sulfurtransferase